MLNFSLAELYIYTYIETIQIWSKIFFPIFSKHERDKNDGENEIYTRIYVSRTD